MRNSEKPVTPVPTPNQKPMKPGQTSAAPPFKRKRQSRAPELRRHELLQAATALFEEKGVAATAISDITERANVAKGTFYLYFASKDELIAALWKDYVDGFMQIADAVDASTARRAPQPGNILELIARLTHHALDHAALHRLVYGSADAAAIALCRQSDENILERLLASMQRNLAGAGWTKSERELQASLIFHGLDGALHRAIMPGGRIDRARFVRSVRRFAANALQLPDEAR
ncbi:hypothetical protein SDC9_95606 [bioreactor metagenome]|uniref:HTH tetR-type domain-containing protein n=1 Tax=bioreactor metagenome TaxID=1076179 RepID=A0A645A6T3_9ZZZZ